METSFGSPARRDLALGSLPSRCSLLYRALALSFSLELLPQLSVHQRESQSAYPDKEIDPSVQK